MFYSDFSSALSFVFSSSYIIVFIAMIIEGPLVTAAASFASSLGYFNVYFIFIMAILGDVIGDCIHYIVGYYGRKAVVKKYAHIYGKDDSFIRKIERKISRHVGKSLFVIKFTPIFTSIGMLLSGALRIPFRKFIFYSVVISIPRAIFFVFVGYYFGEAFESVSSYLSMQYSVIIFIFLAIILYFTFKGVYSKALN